MGSGLIAGPSYGITAFGTYVPRLRIPRRAIAEAHAWMAPGLLAGARGARAFCNWDEDAVTMAVEAGRRALAGGDGQAIDFVTLASTRMPYADLQHATQVAAALRLREETQTLDAGFSQRVGATVMRAALQGARGDQLVIASDRPAARPASSQELAYGAGAAAFRLGTEGVLARLLGSATRSVPFVDHFRGADQQYDYQWEERWVRDEGALKIIPATIEQALRDAGMSLSDCKTLIVAAPERGIGSAVAKRVGFRGDVIDTLPEDSGYAGAAQSLLLLAERLGRAAPGDCILLVSFAHGCEALVLQTTPEIAARNTSCVASAQAPLETDSYLRFLTFEGGLQPEWGMRAEIVNKTALTEQYRSAPQMAGFVGGRCGRCGTTQFPVLPYCVNPACAAPSAQMEPVSLSDLRGRVVTHTADWLSAYKSPPLHVGFVQFGNGARLQMEFTDVGPQGLPIGSEVEMVYRIKEQDPVRGYGRYFWKAAPAAAQET